MKKIVTISFAVAMAMFSCKTAVKKEVKEAETAYVSFGEQISAENTLTQEEMAKKYEAMGVNDTLTVKFTTKINQVCQKKGCWIKVPLDTEKESFVKFKDYAFFMPMNAAGSEVILNGKAFKSEISVSELKHYAEDAGKSAEEIAKITAPKTTYSFLADGVLLATTNE